MKSSASSTRRGRAAKSVKRAAVEGRIDFSDVPEASSKQLRAMRRVGRPRLGDAAGHPPSPSPDLNARAGAHGIRRALG